MDDKEILEKRLDILSTDTWRLFVTELSDMAAAINDIQRIDDEKTLFHKRGQVDMLNMFINLEDTTRLALDQLDEDI